jgi:hypothetical protein
LQNLADRLGLGIRVAHYAPYCSKHNPIEHRVFPCAHVVPCWLLMQMSVNDGDLTNATDLLEGETQRGQQHVRKAL